MKYVRSLPLLAQLCIVTMLLAACSGVQQRDDNASAAIVAPQTDTRAFRYVELDNGLRAIVVSDPGAQKAAASLDVHVGSGADPEQRQGLAHFLEHMLFLGTEKYPDAGEYQQFISAHGGGHNAYTAFEHTNYFFDIEAPFLPDALDRFAQFFIAPLFTAQYVDREKNAVDSEFRANYKNEYRRSADALRDVVNPEHPFHKFSVGSLDTLSNRDGSTIRDDLLKFYQQHYSANIMTLAIVGRESPDELEKMVREKFSAVANRHLKPASIDTPLFASGLLPARMLIAPEKELRQLTLTFPVPDLLPWQLEKPTEYIAYLLGHEGSGSLLSYLKGQGWADALSAGEGINYRGGASLDISITLTRTGVEHENDIIAAVFQAIRRVSEQGVEAWRYQEQAALSDLAFRFRDRQQPMSDVMQLSTSLHYYKPADVMRGNFLMTRFDDALIKRFLQQLTPDNLLVSLMAPGVATDKASTYYGTPYQIRAIDTAQRNAWRSVALNDAITLPAKNPFVPQQLQTASVHTAENAVPQPIIDQSGLHVWHLQDDAFGLPKTNSFFSVRSPLAQSDVRNAALLEWYVQVIQDDLNELSYPAQLAGLGFRIDAHARGFSVRITGYDDKQTVLLQSIIESLHKRSFDPQRALARRNDLLRRWRNADTESPYQVLMRQLRQSLYAPAFSEAALASAIEKLGAADLDQYSAQFWQAVDIEALMVGNASADVARNFGNTLSQALIGKPANLPAVSVARLQPDVFAWRDARLPHADSAVVWYLQGQDQSPQQQALSALTAQIIETPFYQSLRTEQQFGYVVYAGYMPILTVPGVAFVVQSPRYTPGQIEKAVAIFWQAFLQQLPQLDPQQFERNRAALVNQLLEPPKNLGEKTEEFWMSIALGDDDFNRQQEVAAAAQQLTQAQWQEFAQSYLAADQRRDLLLLSGDSKKPATRKKLKTITDTAVFKRESPAFQYQ
jgi:secreted Zn-dependent insulinase-like peptidase